MIVSELVVELNSILKGIKIEEVMANSPFGNDGRINVYPRNEEEIINVVKFANRKDLKVTVAGAGTKKGFGGLEESFDILISLVEYKGIVEQTVGDMTVTVKAGTPFKEVQDYLSAYNQKISLDPAWSEFATIGGVVVANDSGPKRLGYGSARDLVIGTKIIYPDGSVIRTGGKVVKNVAGYDMNKLFIGSMGTYRFRRCSKSSSLPRGFYQTNATF